MHMADALISPIVGGSMMTVSVVLGGYSTKKINMELEEKKIPLMGVMGAFVFAAQMINFAIPGTGSSGHLAGGLLLAILLGPYAGFLTMASVLLIQALFFGDGGLLAYGCNVFNLGFYTCFLVYPYIYRWFTKKGITAKRIFWGSMVSSILAVQLGAFSVVLETVISGKTQLPFTTFVMLMQPIHLGIGLVEGFVTAAVVTFVWKSKPELIEEQAGTSCNSMKKLLGVLAIIAIITGGVLSWFASSDPDGLEWSMEKTAGTAELEADTDVHVAAADIQSRTTLLPDYGFKAADDSVENTIGTTAENTIGTNNTWLKSHAGTSTSGIVGGAMTLILVVLIGIVVNFFKKKQKRLNKSMS